MNRKRSVFIFSFVLFFIIQAAAQVPFTGKELGSEFNRGMELFNKEKYPGCNNVCLIHILNTVTSQIHCRLLKLNIYRAAAALNLFNPDAEYRMITFIRTHPESPRINEAYLALGDYFYQNKNYRKAVIYFEEVNRQELTPARLPEYFFRLGYSLIHKGEQAKSSAYVFRD